MIQLFSTGLRYQAARILIFVLMAQAAFSEGAIANSGDQLSLRIRREMAAGTAFRDYTLFSPAGRQLSEELVTRSTLLRPDAAAVQRLFSEKPEGITITLTGADGSVYPLKLLRSRPFSQQIEAGYIENGRRHVQEAPDLGLHYQGALAGLEHSFATMSVFGDGQVTMLFGDERGNFVVGQLRDGSEDYVLYNDRDLRERLPFECHQDDVDDHRPEAQPPSAQRTTAASGCNRVRIYWETDFGLFQARGSVANVNSYVASLFNVMQALFTNDGINTELKSFYVHTTPDRYDSASSHDALYAFTNRWTAQGGAFGADQAHLIAADPGGNGGVALRSGVCQRNMPYAYSDLVLDLATLPTFSYDAMVVTHETGHSLGSHHTHWCGWNTGPGGSCGSIDNCTVQETLLTSCTSCGQTYNNSAPASAWSGTIMSYCLARGVNLANGFGPLPAAAIQSFVNSASCLTPLMNVTTTPTQICSAGGGAITAAAAPGNLGALPFSYSWSNSRTTATISGLQTAGIYTVTVTDANGCTATLRDSVANAPRPGNGNAYRGTMPISCSSPIPVRLTATVPTNLSSCESVAWLRTTTAITSLNAAQTAFNAANTSDLFFSDNNSTLSATVPAELRVSRPASCNAATTYFYTPFVSRKQRAPVLYTDAGVFLANVPQGSFVIGQAYDIPAHTPTHIACDGVDTPTGQIVVTVSNYTGPANSLLIQVQRGSTLLHHLSGLPGNGTYTIPYSALNASGNPALRVLAVRNCPSGCTANVGMTMTAARVMSYPAVTRPTFEIACATGTSIRMAYAPGGATPLPVSLLSFDGVRRGETNELRWESTGEKGTEHYALERSEDGRTFSTIHSHSWSGAARGSYSFIDAAPPALGFYRLKVSEADGGQSYSAIVRLAHGRATAGAALSLTPNPARQQVTVNLRDARGGAVRIKATNLLGQVVYESTRDAAPGENAWILPVSGYARGIYFLTVTEADGGQLSERLVLE